MRKLAGILLTLFLLSLPSFCQKYKKKQILKDLNNLEGFENAFVGFVLYDTEKGKVVAEQNADKHMTPASVTKLFTYFGTAGWQGNYMDAFEYRESGDSLIFWSTGYPLTLHPDHPDSALVKMLSSTEKDIYYAKTPIVDERFGPGWGWDDFGGYYGAEKSRFPIYGNSVQFIIDSKDESYQMIPSYTGFKVNINQEKSTRARVSRDEFWNEFEIQYAQIDDAQPYQIDTLIRPFRYSDVLFVDLLTNQVGKEIALLEDYSIERNDTKRKLSFPSDSIYKWMLQPSDNLIAEQLLMMTSAEQTDTLSTEKGIEMSYVAMALNNDPELPYPLNWRDGSGLSRYNMFKPREIAALLKALIKTEDPDKAGQAKSRLYELLPQGQTSGTIDELYSPAVYAKTGTLSNNHSLAGYIEADSGKTMIFVLMANHYTVPTKKIREQFGVILEKIRMGY